MITELMIVLIAVGAGIIFIVWLNSRRRRNNELDQQDIEESTNKFKQDLENTANEIIGRMQEQASHLENLLDHSERNRTQLEGRVSELKKLLKKTEGQSTEIRDLLARLDDAVDDVNLMQQQMDLVERKINAAINMPMQVPQMMSPLLNQMMQAQPNLQQAMQRQQMPPQPLNPRQSNLVPSIMLKTPQAQAAAAQMAATQSPEASEEFAKVLAQSMGAGVRPPVPPQPDQNSVRLAQKTNRQVRMVNSPPVQVGGNNQPAATAAQGSSSLSSLERRSRLLAERLSAMKGGNAASPPTPAAKPIQTGISTTQSTDVRRAALDAINKRTAAANPAQTQNQQTNRAGTYTPPRQQPKPAAANNQTAAQSQANETAIIKSMLLAGMTVEEIARETGIGRGAIELVQQIMRLQLGRK